MLGITVNSAAEGYDRFYDPAPGAVGAFMMVPSSAKELREQVELHESCDLLTHVTYASIMTLLTAADKIEATLPENAARIRAYVKDAQQRDVRITQCITDSKGDRSRRPSQQDDPDQYVRIVERRPDGIVIRGAKSAHLRRVDGSRAGDHSHQVHQAGRGRLRCLHEDPGEPLREDHQHHLRTPARG